MFRYLLLFAWGLVIVAVALAFTFPIAISRALHPVVDLLPLIPFILLAATTLYFISSLYLSGIKRRN